MRPGSPILETERLSLRELELSDLDLVAEMLGAAPKRSPEAGA